MREEQIDYNKVVSVVEKTVATSEFYLQSLSLILCFIIAYFFLSPKQKNSFSKNSFLVAKG